MLQITFVNDGTGTEGFGNYNYTVNVNKEQIAHSYIEGHFRANGWEELVHCLSADLMYDDLVKNSREFEEE